MDFDGVKIAVFIKEGAIFSVRTCYRSVRNHPFFVGVVFFFIFLYTYFPSLFAFLVSSSPVIVCTAILLGTLLSFGKPNIPEIEEEEKKSTHEIASLKTGVVERDLVVQKDESYPVDTYVGKRRDTEDEAVEDSGSGEARYVKLNEVGEDDVLGCGSSLIVEELKEVPGEKRVIEVENAIHHSELVHIREFHEETPLMEGVYSAEIHDEKGAIGRENDIHDSEFVHFREFHEETPLMDAVSFATEDDLSSEWQKKEIKHRKEGDNKPSGEYLKLNLEDQLEYPQESSWKQVEDHGGSSDSGSDRAESSSPDASLADIIPMLDELHPLLESEAPRPVVVSVDDSDAASELSHRQKSDDESQNQEEEGEEEVEEEEDDDDDDEGKGDGKEDGTKSVVTWTEDDEKNLMDLGTSELERNQRLENLIARRRARKSLRMEAEKNLIDFESIDPPYNIPPISTKRNPFDLPYDSNDSMGLPPIPGSAPSVLIPRRNPFDLPYDPNEEKPNLMEDSFQEEFTTFHQKDMFFRRHESFSMGASFSGELKQEKHDFRFRPYFVPERMYQEGTSFPTFLRQLSEMSDSKVSSVPETESISSAVDHEEQKNLIQQELSQEVGLISGIECDYKKIENESQSSEDVESVEIDQKEKNDIDISRSELMDEESSHGNESSLPGMAFIAPPPSLDESKIHVKTDIVDEMYTQSTSSPCTVVSEKIFQEKADEEAGSLEPTTGDSTEVSGGALPLKKLDSDSTVGTVEEVDDTQTKEPVYDSSPSAIEKTLSEAAVINDALFYANKGVVTSTSDFQIEISEIGSLPAPVERTIPLMDDESAVHDSIEKEMTSGNEEFSADPSHLRSVDENESRSREVTEISEHDVINVGFSTDQNPEQRNAPVALEPVVEHVSVHHSSSSSLETESGEDLRGGEANMQLKLDEDHSSNFSTDIHVQAFQDIEEKADPIPSTYPDVSSDNIISSKLEKELSLEEKFMTHTSAVGNLEEHQELSVVLDHSIEESSIFNDVNYGARDHEDKDLSSLSPFPSTSVPTSISLMDSQEKFSTDLVDWKGDAVNEIQNQEQGQILVHISDAIGSHVTEEKIKEELEEIKDIDEDLLTELDKVGDFSVKEMGANINPEEKQLPADGECLQQNIFEHMSIGSVEADSNRSIEFKDFVDPPELSEAGLRSPNVRDDYKYLNLTERTSEVHSLDTSSLEVEVSSFQDSVNGDGEKPMILESINDKSLQNEDVSESSEYEIANQDPTLVESSSELTVLEARSLEDLNLAFEQVSEEVEKPFAIESLDTRLTGEEELKVVTDLGLSERDHSLTETHLELTILEARSLEGIDSHVKQLNKGRNIEKSILPEPAYGHSYVVETKNSVETDSDLQLTETRSVGDINLASDQLSEVRMENLPQLVESKDMSAEIKEGGELEEPNHPASLNSKLEGEELKVLPDLGLSEADPSLTEINSELPVLEARSFEDIDSLIEQLNEGRHIEKPIRPEPADDSPYVVESENSVATYSNLQVVETSAVEDINLAVDQLSEGTMEHLPKQVESKFMLAAIQEGGELEKPTHPDMSAKIKEGRELEKPNHPDLSPEIKGEGKLEKPAHLESLSTKLVGEELNVVTNLGLSERNSPLTQTNVELPVLGTRSLEDTDSHVKQLNEGENIEKPILLDPADGNPPVKFQNSVVVNSDLQVVEARSVEEIKVALDRFSEGGMDNRPELVESKDMSTDIKEGRETEKSIHPESIDNRPREIEFIDKAEVNSNLLVVEAASVDDIHLAFKDLSKSNLESMPKEVESIERSADIKEKGGGESEKVILPESNEEVQSVVESKYSEENNPALQGAETKHLEDTHMALKQPSETGIEKFPEPCESKEGSEVVAKEVESVKEIDSTAQKSHTSVEGSQHELKEVSKDSSTSASGVKGKKVRSHRSRSRSSSSSSDSD